MDLLITPNGNLRCVYEEAIDLATLGNVSIQRGSYVEPISTGEWTADLSPVQGPLLGPFSTRSEALKAEIDWLQQNWLTPAG